MVIKVNKTLVATLSLIGMAWAMIQAHEADGVICWLYQVLAGACALNVVHATIAVAVATVAEREKAKR